MKPGIHPTWYPEAVVTCACGNTFTTGSTRKEIHTDVCSNCHPFFTGEQRIVDTAGQVERFMKRAGAKDRIAATRSVAPEKPGKKGKGHEEKPGMPVAPSELPLAVVVEDKLEEIAPELPAMPKPMMEKLEPEPVVQVQPVMPRPIAPIETLPPKPSVREPVAEPIAEMPRAPKKVAKRIAKPTAKKAAVKKPAAKKKAAPKAKLASKPKASVAKKSKPKTTAKKKSKK